VLAWVIVNRASATPLVNRSIRKVAWPALRALGLVQGTTRSAWRSRLDTINVVNFQSAVGAGGDALFLGSEEDGRDTKAALGSFSVNLGTYYAVRQHLPWRPCVYASGGTSLPGIRRRVGILMLLALAACDPEARVHGRLAASGGHPLTVGEIRIECPKLCLYAPVRGARGDFDETKISPGCPLSCQLRAASVGHRDFVAPASKFCVKRNGSFCAEFEADVTLEPSR
jgi:hypothetical protein